MCGITGRVELNGSPPDETRLTEMTNAIAHRGPDDAGVVCVDNVGLGHRRLSILDLSPLGHQPMQSADGTVWIVFNGEIYNYKPLKAQLEQAGHTFKGTSDTEVILAAYQQNPTGFIQQLHGMFAFALYDTVRGQLVLARDRMGKKPLVYQYQPGQFFAFASEVKALLAMTDTTHTINPLAVGHYLALGFVPSPMSAFEGIETLPAGYSAILDTRQGTWVQPPSRYWDLSPTVTPTTLPQAIHTFETLMDQSIAMRLQSDVPVGVLLSGGLDSSCVTALVREHIGRDTPLHTFSVGFDVPGYDERAKARAASDAFGTEHHEAVCTAEDFLAVLPDVLQHTDSLFAEQLVPMYLVSKLASQTVKVVLSGDGADEVLGGYNSYANVLKLRKLLAIPGLRQAGLTGLELAQPWLSQSQKRQWSRVQNVIESPAHLDYLAYRYATMPSAVSPNLLQANSPILNAMPNPRQALETLYEQTQGFDPTNPLNQCLYTDIKTNMPEYILMKSDRMSMAHGVEVRCPFLDTDVVSFLFGLAPSLKRKSGQSKFLLRHYLQSRVPERIWNQKKMGFSAPFSVWMRTHAAFRANISHLFSAMDAEALQLGLNLATIEDLIRQHAQGQADHGQTLWSLLILLAWAKNHTHLTPSAQMSCAVSV